MFSNVPTVVANVAKYVGGNCAILIAQFSTQEHVHLDAQEAVKLSRTIPKFPLPGLKLIIQISNEADMRFVCDGVDWSKITNISFNASGN